jgi:hypothetical protein
MSVPALVSPMYSRGVSNGQGRGEGDWRENYAFDAVKRVSTRVDWQFRSGAAYQASLMPMRRALRKVRMMVDMVDDGRPLAR